MRRVPREWKAPFGTWPSWACPTCQKSTLNVVGEAFQQTETGASRKARDADEWEPSWVTRRFTLTFQCASKQCGEVVVCVGDAGVNDSYDGGYHDAFTPLYFHPPLKFFRVAPECPEEVQSHLERAFGMAWSDTASTVNALRSTLEAILTDRKVARTAVNAKKTRTPLNLQIRIDRYVTKDPEAADLMKALRWLGNNGSHAHGKAPEMPDLLDAFAIMEHVIGHIYVQSGKAVAKLAKDIVKNKGKPKAAPKKKGALRQSLRTKGP